LDTCSACGEPLSDRGTCLNADCRLAHKQATRSAAMPREKATAVATRDVTSAWTRSGGVD